MFQVYKQQHVIATAKTVETLEAILRLYPDKKDIFVENTSLGSVLTFPPGPCTIES